MARTPDVPAPLPPHQVQVKVTMMPDPIVVNRGELANLDSQGILEKVFDDGPAPVPDPA